MVERERMVVRVVTARLHRDQVEALRALAAMRRLPVAALLREAVDAYLALQRQSSTPTLAGWRICAKSPEEGGD